MKSAHVVKIYDYGLTDNQTPFIVMELLEGTDLSRRIDEERKLSWRTTVTIITQLCKALERAHERGVVHRDVKPENIFLSSEGGEIFVKLLDFGVAKTEQSTSKSPTPRRSTMAGESLGTPFYMSPEQFRNSKDVDHRADLWAVGVVVYEALTGTLPFIADTVAALAIVVSEAVAPAPSVLDPTLPKELDAWFAKACARDPATRFQSARELSDALRASLGEVPDVRASLPSLSSSARIVVAASADLSLRETAFATSSGGLTPRPTPTAPRRTKLALAAGAAALALVSAAIWATRAQPAPARAESSASTASNAAAPSSPEPLVSALPALPTRPALPAPSTSMTSQPFTQQPSAAKPAPSGKAPAKPASSASSAPQGGKHDEIW